MPPVTRLWNKGMGEQQYPVKQKCLSSIEWGWVYRVFLRTNGLWGDPARRLAVLTGRIHNRPQAPSPSQSLYRHGRLSLMEMLTPWFILGPKEESHEGKSRNPD